MTSLKSYVENHIYPAFPFKFFKKVVVGSYFFIALLLGVGCSVADAFLNSRFLEFGFLMVALTIFGFGVLAICSVQFSTKVLRENVSVEDAKYGIYFLIYTGLGGIALIYSDYILALFWAP
ncbi:hypothetical protein D0C16_16000 [Cellvibrio sp. KY-GH-1]|uniref:hypothetical protein n=1 Tax=Cellvibrio sp. KY-GH-1 TaxID=2303332 RepID=UPI001248C89B|nr:hypothetical protein [Cellvibrio sp. KY-GH-1]QEY17349.1 hypothetical protein D0C16_16000 [Cellvibrio sp. KY-GH-1]